MAKVLLLNGSPRQEGDIAFALGEMIRVMEGEGLETELIQLGGQAIRGCADCGFCRENGRCVFTEDPVNEVAAKLEGADALVVSSPVYFNSPSGTILSFLDRLFYSVPYPLNRKIGACVVSSDGGGIASSIDTLNQYFVLRGMPVASISYWDPAYSAAPDTDGSDRLVSIRNLAGNISAMVKALTTPDETGAFPEVKSEYYTSFLDGLFEQLRKRPVNTFLLDEKNTVFPDPKYVSDIGLLAIGGSITTETLVTAYSLGIFPWEEEGAPLMWWCPREKFVLIPSEVHVDHRLEKYMANHEVTLRVDRDFMDTMHHCRTRRESTGKRTWITDEVEEAYGELCRAGYTISAEAYVDGVLAGGFYGLRIGRCVIGESMFSDQPNGSKMALYLLAKYLEKRNCLMIDCQVSSDYLVRMGGKTHQLRRIYASDAPGPEGLTHISSGNHGNVYHLKLRWEKRQRTSLSPRQDTCSRKEAEPMELNSVTIKPWSREFAQVKALLKSQFPKDELPSMPLLRLSTLRQDVECVGFYDGVIFIGFYYLELAEGAVFLLYLVVNPALQSKGYGAAILREIQKKYPGVQIDVHIEIPRNPDSKDEQAARRYRFYERCGFAFTGFTTADSGEDYWIISSAGKGFDTQKHQAFLEKDKKTGEVVFRWQKP